MQMKDDEVFKLTRAFLVRFAPDELSALDELAGTAASRRAAKEARFTFDWKQHFAEHWHTFAPVVFTFFGAIISAAASDAGKAKITELFKRLLGVDAEKPTSCTMSDEEARAYDAEVDNFLDGELGKHSSPEHRERLRRDMKNLRHTKARGILEPPKK